MNPTSNLKFELERWKPWVQEVVWDEEQEEDDEIKNKMRKREGLPSQG